MTKTGFLNLAKPSGTTSRSVVDLVCRAAHTKRVGHAGTLDPLASGVLVAAVGSATRLVEYVQAQSKTYEAEFLLGQTSPTDDVEGEVVVQHVEQPPSAAEVLAGLRSFEGATEQTPPQFSAVKVAGERAYRAARAGRTLQLSPKVVTVHSIEVQRYEYPALTLRIVCGSGTYIRAIARDLGTLLGVGGLMSALVRTAVGEFRLQDAVAPELLTPETWADSLRPLCDGVASLPRIELQAGEAAAFAMGQSFTMEAKVVSTVVEAAAFTEGRFLGIAKQLEVGTHWRAIKGGF